jgi:hypothetical protein
MSSRLRIAAALLPVLLIALTFAAPARAQIPTEPNMVVEAEGAGLGRVEITLSTQGSRKPALFVLNAENGAVAGGIALPKEGGAEYEINAYDTEGKLTHFGRGTIGTVAQTAQGAELMLEPIDSDAGLVVSVNRQRLVLHVDPFDGSPEKISVRAEAFDALGKRAFINPGELTWQLTNGRLIHLLPKFDEPGVDLVPDKDQEVYELCPLEPKVFACKIGSACKPVRPCDDPFARVSAGSKHTCALTRNGFVRCWGDNSFGQLGAQTIGTCGTTSPACSTTPIPIACPPDSPCRFTHIASGWFLTAAVDVNGEVWWWGRGDPTHRRVSAVLNGAAQKFTYVAAGMGHACAISQSRSEVWCWGFNGNGETGSPDTINDTSDSAPYRPMVSMKFKRLAAGGWHTCGVGQAGTDVVCWGSNLSLESSGTNFGGYPDPMYGPYFFQHFGGLVSISDVAASITRSCANVNFGASCWGGGHMALNVSAFGHPDKVTVGKDHVCVLQSNQQASCMGGNQEGQLGIGTAAQSSAFTTTPATVLAPAPGFTDLSAGDAHTCGVTPDGDIFCWGRNVSGQLGNGSFTFTANPTPTMVLR